MQAVEEDTEASKHGGWRFEEEHGKIPALIENEERGKTRITRSGRKGCAANGRGAVPDAGDAVASRGVASEGNTVGYGGGKDDEMARGAAVGTLGLELQIDALQHASAPRTSHDFSQVSRKSVRPNFRPSLAIAWIFLFCSFSSLSLFFHFLFFFFLAPTCFNPITTVVLIVCSVRSFGRLRTQASRAALVPRAASSRLFPTISSSPIKC